MLEARSRNVDNVKLDGMEIRDVFCQQQALFWRPSWPVLNMAPSVGVDAATQTRYSVYRDLQHSCSA